MTDLNIFFRAYSTPVFTFLIIIKKVPALNDLPELPAAETLACLEEFHVDRVLRSCRTVGLEKDRFVWLWLRGLS